MITKKLYLVLLWLVFNTNFAHASSQAAQAPEEWLDEYVEALPSGRDTPVFIHGVELYKLGLSDIATPAPSPHIDMLKMTLSDMSETLNRALPERLDPNKYENDTEAAIFLLGSLCHTAIFSAYRTSDSGIIPIKNFFLAALYLDRFIIATESPEKAEIANQIAIDLYEQLCDLTMQVMTMPRTEQSNYVADPSTLCLIDTTPFSRFFTLLQEQREVTIINPAKMAFARFKIIEISIKNCNFIKA